MHFLRWRCLVLECSKCDIVYWNVREMHFLQRGSLVLECSQCDGFARYVQRLQLFQRRRVVLEYRTIKLPTRCEPNVLRMSRLQPRLCRHLESVGWRQIGHVWTQRWRLR